MSYRTQLLTGPLHYVSHVSGPNIKSYYGGVASFIKTGCNLDASFTLIATDEVPHLFDVYIMKKEGDAVSKLEEGQSCELGTLKIVACIPKDSDKLQGIMTTLPATFCDLANAVGCALVL